ncbi:MAG: helix-turn-helix transcriptional regulator [Cyclobacteriaceae bacterium]
MNPAFPDQVLNGVILCLCIQLMLLGIYKISTKDTRSILLGVLCFVIGAQQVYNMYWIFFRESAFFSILLANYKNLFFGPLVYLYVALSVSKKNVRHQLILHLILPTSVFVFYTSVKHIFDGYYINHYVQIITGIQYLYLLMNLSYLVLGIYLFKHSSLLIKPKVRSRYIIFYFGLLGYLLLLQLYGLISPFMFEDMESAFTMSSRFVLMPSAILIYGYISFFVIVESNNLKSLFLGETLLVTKEILEGKDDIRSRLKVEYFDPKMFKQPNLSLADVASKVGIGERALAEFFRNEYRTNFQDLTNSLRIEEFKKLSQSESFNHLDLSGIAQESGFASKATFYRVFKKKVGITPNEYIKSLYKPA